MNDSITVFPLRAYTGDQDSPDLDNADSLGVHLVVAITASGVGGSNVSFYVEGKDDYSDTYYTLIQSATLTINGTIVVKVYPGLAVGTNTANDHLPRIWRVRADHSSTTDPITYSVAGSLLD